MKRELSLVKKELTSIILLISLSFLASCSAPNRSDAPGTATVTTGTGVTVSSNPTSLSTFGLASITATVRDAAGALVADGTSVTFTVSDSTIGALSSGTATTTSGLAKVNFTAGNKPGNVSITATSGGVSGSVAILVSASSTSALSLMASPSAIPVSGTSTITTHVVDASGNPVVDNTLVTFSLDDPSKGVLSSSNAFTSNGDAIITLTASATGSGTLTISAASGGKTGTISISITGGITGGTMTMAASSTSITTNGTSTISATIKDSSGNPIPGATVSFTLSSTAATLSSPTATTDASGVAQVTLTAGSSAASVTVTATSSTLTSLTTITITQSTGIGTMTLSASPTSISTASTSTITATIKDGTNNPISGVTVSFTLSSAVATLGSPTAVTNASGVAQVVLTSGTTPTSVTVTTAATTSSGTLNGTVIINITAPPASSVSVAVNPSSITVLGTTTITATVLDSNGNAVIDGTAVGFSLSSELYGSLSSTTTTTANSNGTATTTFTGGNTAGTVTVTATSGTVSSSTAITVVPASTGSISFVSATPQVIGIKSSGQTASSAVAFLVNDINGNPVSDGTAVSFTMKGPGGGAYIGDVDATPTEATGSTVGGNATVILNSGTIAGPVTITASTNINSGTPTTVSTTMTATQTTVSVASTTGFPASGRIRIDNELIDYTGITATTFTGCTRGAVSTTALGHASGVKVYNQDTISSSATQISIGGGVPSAAHWGIAAAPFNLPGLILWGSTIKSQISAYMADRFGIYNVLEGQSVSYYTEAGAIERQGITTTTVTASAGIAQADLRTQNPMPKDVARAMAGDAISNAYFGGVNEPWYTTGGVTYNPRDGWVTALATTQGEETFADENVDGLFTRSYATSICPYGYSCECDGGVTNGYSGSVSGGAACAAGKRSEGFIDLGEPFYDLNDDGTRDNGQTDGKPFELFIDANQNGTYDTPNSMWDGPDCQSPTSCERSKMIWDDVRIVFSGSPVFYPLPDGANCYNCNAFAAGSFAVAPANIAKGASGSFVVIVGDRNLNKLEGGTTIAVTATKGTVSPATIPDIPDSASNPSTGPSVIGFNVEISATETAPQTTVTVEVTTPRGVWSIITVVPII